MKKKLLSIALSLMMVVTCTTAAFMNNTDEVNAYSAGHTRAEAVNWAYSQVGKSLDYDGWYGCQCVDLIKYYYDYLGNGSYATGNADKYKYENVPPGWTRVYSNFQPGDIAVWNGCHVGIITEADSVGFNCINQNYNEHSYCEKVWFNNNKLHSAIRPDFATPATTKTEPAKDNSKKETSKKETSKKAKYVNKGKVYASYGVPLETSKTRVCVGYGYYHFCGAKMGNSANFEQTGNYNHWDEIKDPSTVTEVKSGPDGDNPNYTYYYLKWKDSGNWAYCSSGHTCDGSYGSHGQRTFVWYKVYYYQDRVLQK